MYSRTRASRPIVEPGLQDLQENPGLKTATAKPGLEDLQENPGLKTATLNLQQYINHVNETTSPIKAPHQCHLTNYDILYNEKDQSFCRHGNQVQLRRN